MNFSFWDGKEPGCLPVLWRCKVTRVTGWEECRQALDDGSAPSALHAVPLDLRWGRGLDRSDRKQRPRK